jgi:hypothetical protein
VVCSTRPEAQGLGGFQKSSPDYFETPKVRAGWAGLVGLVAQMANAGPMVRPGEGMRGVEQSNEAHMEACRRGDALRPGKKQASQAQLCALLIIYYITIRLERLFAWLTVVRSKRPEAQGLGGFLLLHPVTMGSKKHSYGLEQKSLVGHIIMRQ